MSVVWAICCATASTLARSIAAKHFGAVTGLSSICVCSVQAKLSARWSGAASFAAHPLFLPGACRPDGHRMTLKQHQQATRAVFPTSRRGVGESARQNNQRVPAPELETAVVDAIRLHLRPGRSLVFPLERPRACCTSFAAGHAQRARAPPLSARRSCGVRRCHRRNCDFYPGGTNARCSMDGSGGGADEGHHPRAGAQYADEVGQPRTPSDGNRQGAQVDQGHRARSELRRHRPAGKKGRTAHPPFVAARLRVPADHHGPPGGHRTGQT